ncbi:DUF3995 domain-containing protein [Nocardiopsis sp. ATB16-24]|uniref:DUF3995 domain-containing protein n=1 Tax=Nocardiopsis sp. ATB16-24 TaxID=3019555 RepID=UPI002557183E|nr:DUF3995 domain-containing protein [Nocardiopsis sp. ATB16-24]
MTTPSAPVGRPSPLTSVVAPRRHAYAAALWAFLFALISLHWALGGEWLLETIGEAVTRPARDGDPAMVAAVWASVLVKFAAVVAALGLVQAWGRAFPRWFLVGGGWLAAALLLLYGGAGLVQQLLMVAGIVGVSETFAPVLHWHLFLWSPYWLAGGVLFALATAALARATRR